MRKFSLTLLISFIICYSECAYYNMIFHEDFDTSSLNQSKWSTVVQNSPVRNELSYYTYENVFLNYNYLFLRAQRRPFGTYGTSQQPQPQPQPQQPPQAFVVNQNQQQQQQQQQVPFTQYNSFTNGYQNMFNGQRFQNGFNYNNYNNYNSMRDGITYTSGKVSTKGRFEFLYGTVEVRAKFPKGRGFLPVISLVDVMRFAPIMSFMAPSTYDRQNKLISSYILENNNMMRSDDFNVFNNNNYFNNYTREFTQMYVQDLTDDFHMYKFVWDPNFVVWYLDEREVLRVSDPERIPNRKMAIEMYLSVGNKDYMYEEPDMGTTFPSYMVIDYVSVQQYSMNMNK